MILPKCGEKHLELACLNLSDRKTHESILSRQLSKTQLATVLKRIKALLKKQREAETVSHLNDLKRELRSKYSIDISRDIIDHFILTSEKVQSPREQLDFECIEREIKSSLAEISKKKYFLNSQNKTVTLTKKILSAEKRKRRHMHTTNNADTMPNIRSLKNFDEIFIRDKLAIFQGYLEEEEIGRFEQELLRRVQAIDQLNYGRFAQRVKHYTIFDMILQRVFGLVQQDTRNIEIRTCFQRAYMRMKEEMVAIVTNEEEVTSAVKRLKNQSQENLMRSPPKQHPKKNYFQADRDRQDLTAQIEQTLEGAKRHLKDAFIKRGRPDFAYEMELMLESRKTPTGPKRIRF